MMLFCWLDNCDIKRAVSFVETGGNGNACGSASYDNDCVLFVFILFCSVGAHPETSCHYLKARSSLEIHQIVSNNEFYRYIK
jgi:hypothetical protein